MNDISHDALPQQGEIMGFKLLPDGRTLITHHYRRPDGKATCAKKTIDSQDKRRIAMAVVELIANVEGMGSLTDKTYQHLSQYYRENRGVKGMEWHFAKAEELLGKYRPDRKFAAHYDKAITSCRASGWSQNTIANVQSVVQRVLRLAWDKSLIPEMPIRDFGIKREFRDRLLTDAEMERFLRRLANRPNERKTRSTKIARDPLYWSVRFLLERPVRGRSDLWRMTERDLVLIGPGAPYIRYKPLKTGKRRQEYTHLPLADISPDILDYLVHGRPKGCPLLFPRVLWDGRWESMGYPIKRWRKIIEDAEISNFEPHDLKHHAITHMIRDQGYSMERLKELGIQYSEQSIDVYWSKKAMKVLEQIQAEKETRESATGDYDAKCVALS